MAVGLSKELKEKIRRRELIKEAERIIQDIKKALEAKSVTPELLRILKMTREVFFLAPEDEEGEKILVFAEPVWDLESGIAYIRRVGGAPSDLQ